jgi:hypothetical protein
MLEAVRVARSPLFGDPLAELRERLLEAFRHVQEQPTPNPRGRWDPAPTPEYRAAVIYTPGALRLFAARRIVAWSWVVRRAASRSSPAA